LSIELLQGGTRVFVSSGLVLPMVNIKKTNTAGVLDDEAVSAF